MFGEIKINHRSIPLPSDSLKFKSEKIKEEFLTEAGTTQISVTRNSKLTIEGTFTVTGEWAERFRNWSIADSVTVSCYYPDADTMSNHTCQLIINSETHINKSRSQVGKSGLYEMEIALEEL